VCEKEKGWGGGERDRRVCVSERLCVTVCVLYQRDCVSWRETVCVCLRECVCVCVLERDCVS
jgi:hypothetical protein